MVRAGPQGGGAPQGGRARVGLPWGRGPPRFFPGSPFEVRVARCWFPARPPRLPARPRSITAGDERRQGVGVGPGGGRRPV